MTEAMRHTTKVNLECLIFNTKCVRAKQVYREQLASIKK